MIMLLLGPVLAVITFRCPVLAVIMLLLGPVLAVITFRCPVLAVIMPPRPGPAS